MSVQAMAWAIEQQRTGDPATRHVLLVLANYADKVGRNAFPAVATLAKETGLSRRTVQSKLEALLKAGLIRSGNQRIAAAEIPRSDRRPKVYDLDMDGARGAAIAPRRAERGAGDDRNGVQSAQRRGAGAAPEPKASINRTGRKFDSTKPQVASEALADCLALLKEVA